MTLEDKFNRIVIKHYRKWTNNLAYPFSWNVLDELSDEVNIKLYNPSATPDDFRAFWKRDLYLHDLAERYYHGKWRPRNKQNKAINPWLELGHAMLKELRKKGWDIRER